MLKKNFSIGLRSSKLNGYVVLTVTSAPATLGVSVGDSVGEVVGEVVGEDVVGEVVGEDVVGDPVGDEVVGDPVEGALKLDKVSSKSPRSSPKPWTRMRYSVAAVTDMITSVVRSQPAVSSTPPIHVSAPHVPENTEIFVS
jgi:hypothetical protein